jgi:hypothetical protein
MFHMLPWEARERTRNAPGEEAALELLYNESEVAGATAGFGPDDYYLDEYDAECRVCGGPL